ncbi:citrate lyase subunit alpha [Terasakiella sp. SH-1]|uniref:citrate lyase subunit alpha n=1 Tax=Terasakiella sp. SH-1 TaxID=2560057 RepID=UPI00142F5A22|nr:citrate lyase subunit alpha [Terasakiella sp. SH-1]
MFHLIDKTPDRAFERKVLGSIENAFDACKITDGMTLSFHHHLRNGDAVVNQVLHVAENRGLKDLCIAISSIFPVHEPMVQLIRSGVIARIRTDYALGPVADEICNGTLKEPALFQSHGGRARALETGEYTIDIAFVGAPCADMFGNISGAIGKNACGPLGYPKVDVDYADKVVVITEEVKTSALDVVDIPASRVDYVVKVDSIGDASGIKSGATQVATDPVSVKVAEQAAEVIAAAGVMTEGFSFQTGAGGISLAVTKQIGEMMKERGIKGDFIAGGITKSQIDLVKKGIFKRVVNVQSFDQDAVKSYKIDSWHETMSASKYASPANSEAIVDQLGVMLLGAAEIDHEFNVNVTTGGDGRIIGGPGGHPDTAAGSRLAVVTTRLTGGGYPKVADKVGCITTPGDTVDVLVTDHGIAVNPKRENLKERLITANLPVVEMSDLVDKAKSLATKAPYKATGKVCALMEGREGQIIDEINSQVL